MFFWVCYFYCLKTSCITNGIVTISYVVMEHKFSGANWICCHFSNLWTFINYVSSLIYYSNFITYCFIHNLKPSSKIVKGYLCVPNVILIYFMKERVILVVLLFFLDWGGIPIFFILTRAYPFWKPFKILEICTRLIKVHLRITSCNTDSLDFSLIVLVLHYPHVVHVYSIWSICYIGFSSSQG